MRLTLVNSTAPGTVALLSPFFEALAQAPDVELAVLEQVPAPRGRLRADLPAEPCQASPHYRLEPIPTYGYNRRHACAQVLSGRFRRTLVETDPDIIYILGEPGYLSTYQVVRFARRALARAMLCLFTAQNVYQRFPPPFPSIERWVLKEIDYAFPIGQDHEDVLRRKGYRGPAAHLPLGVDTNTFTPRSSRPPPGDFERPGPVVGYVGDLLPARNLPLLIEAAGLCRTPVNLLIVGDGPDRRRLALVAARHGLNGSAKFVGRVPHARVPEYIGSMDVLVLPSKPTRNRCFGVFAIANAEQFGRVLVEAMACAKPVVGSTCGEIPKVIGSAGRVFPEGDRHALASAMDELCSDRELRRRLGQAGLERARTHYDWRVIARQLLSVMRSILAESAAERRTETGRGRMALGAAVD